MKRREYKRDRQTDRQTNQQTDINKRRDGGRDRERSRRREEGRKKQAERERQRQRQRAEVYRRMYACSSSTRTMCVIVGRTAEGFINAAPIVRVIRPQSSFLSSAAGRHSEHS